MRLAIMQPYFLPYLGYFALIKYTDYFVVFDTPQFIRHGWIERNRILKPQEGWQYIKVPLEKHSRETSIKDIRINNSLPWREKILAQLTHYKRKAKYFNIVIDLVNDIISLKTDSITELNTYGLEKVSNYLGIDFKYSIFSKMGLNIQEIQAPDDWALSISKELNATEYINPIGGRDFFDTIKYEKSGINLNFLDIKLNKYNQHRNNFEAGLSIVDVMFFNSPDSIYKMLDDYELKYTHRRLF
ncbi:MAG: WbqC family protein [Bacteroidales bacterium]|nr:WbqC family protein [Bacteroidales bacterium]